MLYTDSYMFNFCNFTIETWNILCTIMVLSLFHYIVRECFVKLKCSITEGTQPMTWVITNNLDYFNNCFIISYNHSFVILFSQYSISAIKKM